jgi:hypothetical protein
MTKPRLLSIFILVALLSISSISFAKVQQEENDQVEITFPGPGNAVQGLVQITGTANIADFQSYRLEFSLQNAASPSWFLIHQQSSPVIDGILGEWDTSVLTDGEYMLRLSIYTQSNATTTVLVENIRIRNYSPIETDTPAPTSEDKVLVSTPTVIATPTSPPPSSPTPLPPNPIAISPNALQKAAITGIIIGFLGVVLILIYTGVRQKP